MPPGLILAMPNPVENIFQSLLEILFIKKFNLVFPLTLYNVKRPLLMQSLQEFKGKITRVEHNKWSIRPKTTSYKNRVGFKFNFTFETLMKLTS